MTPLQNLTSRCIRANYRTHYNAYRIATKAACSIWTEKNGHKSVLDILEEKDPAPNKLNSSYAINQSEFQTLAYRPAIFEKINASIIRRAAMKTHGNHGPSGLDANEWRRILTTFKSSPTDLCKIIARLAVKSATERLTFLESYKPCRLIALDENPGVWPIGIGIVLRGIIGRSIVQCIKTDLKLLGGNNQFCLYRKSCIEHAIHSLRDLFWTNGN